ncbi:D-2-hydroxyacid dehydrogenase [Fusibacter bizertensis]
MKIVVLDGFALNPGDLSWDALNALGDVTIYDRTPKEDVLKRAEDADIIFTNKTLLKAPQLEALPKLKYIGVLATGYNIVDTEFAKAKGIVVTNVPTYGTKSVAQFVFAHLLEICHHVAEHAESVRQEKWNRNEDFSYWSQPLIELDGKVMGIIGTGRIGVETAKIACAFGMKVIAYAPRPNFDLEGEIFKYESLENLFKTSDVISLHCPLTDETRGMLNQEAFDQMKEGVIIINTSRGPLIDEEALLVALKSGKVYAAGLDVLAKEPPKEYNPLYAQTNCNITPHIAWAPRAARQRLLMSAVENLKSFLDGNPINQVNS